jgi:hypothetical protein
MLRMIRARIGNMLERHCWAVSAGLRGFKFNLLMVSPVFVPGKELPAPQSEQLWKAMNFCSLRAQ